MQMKHIYFQDYCYVESVFPNEQINSYNVYKLKANEK